jgi:ribosomal protein S18 acetylase RimI-like enzyme
MNGFRDRSYVRSKDLKGVRELVDQCPPFVRWYFLPDRLPDDPRRVHLWEDERGKLKGAAFLRGPSDDISGTFYLSYAVHPDAATLVGEAVIHWGKTRSRELFAPPLILSCRASIADRTRIGSLEQQGFRSREEKEILVLSRRLDKSVRNHPLPGNYVARPFSNEMMEEWIRLCNQTQGEKLTSEERMVWMQRPSYVPDLDFVCTDQEGQLVAYCLGNLFRNADGTIDDAAAWILRLGTHPNYRGEGLGTALFRLMLTKFRNLGCSSTLLNVFATNDPARKLYDSEGCECLYRMKCYVSSF